MALRWERLDHLAHASGRHQGDAPPGWDRYGPLDFRPAPRLPPDAGWRSPTRRLRLVHIGNDLPFQWSGRPKWWRNGHRAAGGRELDYLSGHDAGRGIAGVDRKISVACAGAAIIAADAGRSVTRTGARQSSLTAQRLPESMSRTAEASSSKVAFPSITGIYSDTQRH